MIVAVQDGTYIQKYKPNAKVLYTTEERMELVRALKVVDEVVIYRDVNEDIKRLDFDVFAIGEDQTHSGFQQAVSYCEKEGKQVVRMKRTEGISSSEIKDHIK